MSEEVPKERFEIRMGEEVKNMNPIKIKNNEGGVMRMFKIALVIAAMVFVWGCKGGYVTTLPPAGPEDVVAVHLEYASGTADDNSSLGLTKSVWDYVTGGFGPGDISTTGEAIDMICQFYIHTTNDDEALIQVRDLTAPVPDAPCGGVTNCINCANFWREDVNGAWVVLSEPYTGKQLNNCLEVCDGIVTKSNASELTHIEGEFVMWSHINATTTNLARAAILQQGWDQDFDVDPLLGTGELDFSDVFLNLSPTYMKTAGGGDFDISIVDNFLAQVPPLTSPEASYDGTTYTAVLSITDALPLDAKPLGEFTFKTSIPVSIQLVGASIGDIDLTVDPPAEFITTWCEDVGDCVKSAGLVHVPQSANKNAMNGEDLGAGLDSPALSVNLTGLMNVGATIESVSATAIEMGEGDAIAVSAYTSDVDDNVAYAILDNEAAYAQENKEIAVKVNLKDSDNFSYTDNVILSLGNSLSHSYLGDGATNLVSHFLYNVDDAAIYTELDPPLTYNVNDYMAMPATVLTAVDAANYAEVDAMEGQMLFDDNDMPVGRITVLQNQQVEQATFNTDDFMITAGLYTNGAVAKAVGDNWDADAIGVGYCVHAPIAIRTSGETDCVYVAKVVTDAGLMLINFVTVTAFDPIDGIETEPTSGCMMPALDQTETQVRIINDAVGLRVEFMDVFGSWVDMAGYRDCAAFGSDPKELSGWGQYLGAGVIGWTQTIFQRSSASVPGDYFGVIYGPQRNAGFIGTDDASSGFPDIEDEVMFNLLEFVGRAL